MPAVGRRFLRATFLGLVALVGLPEASARERTLVALRARDDRALRTLLAAQQDPTSPEYHRWLTPREFGERFGPTRRDVKQVERWLRREGCRIRRSPARQHVECVDAHLGVVPASLAPLVDAVLDLRAPLEIAHRLGAVDLQPLSVAADGTFFFSPEEYAAFYDLASVRAAGIDGTGERIGIVGTAPVDPSNIAAFRTAFGLPALELEQHGTPVPNLHDEDVLEANLDVSWSGAVAPGAAVLLSITSGTLVDAIEYLVNRADVSVLSLSVAFVPSPRTRPFIRQALGLFEQAAAQGQTVLIASGDFGALRTEKPPTRGVDAFAQSPFVTGVGGTTPSAPTPDAVTAYGSEVVWQEGRLASGGGRSALPRPAYQAGLKSRRRTVPDVSLAAAAVYPVPKDGGVFCCVSGTSAAAPAWAGLVALLNQQKGKRAGFLNPALYQLGAAQASGGAVVFHDIVEGSSRTRLGAGFRAKPGYDLATGWGTPIGSALLAAFP
jgi:subtilase family serine protease